MTQELTCHPKDNNIAKKSGCCCNCAVNGQLEQDRVLRNLRERLSDVAVTSCLDVTDEVASSDKKGRGSENEIHSNGLGRALNGISRQV